MPREGVAALRQILLREQILDSGVLALVWNLSGPPHGGGDAVALAQEISVPVEESLVNSGWVPNNKSRGEDRK